MPSIGDSLRLLLLPCFSPAAAAAASSSAPSAPKKRLSTSLRSDPKPKIDDSGENSGGDVETSHSGEIETSGGETLAAARASRSMVVGTIFGPRRGGHVWFRTMRSMTVAAGVIPPAPEDMEEVMYMRANYEHVVGSADSESFHLISPDRCPGQELSVFLLRSR